MLQLEDSVTLPFCLLRWIGILACQQLTLHHNMPLVVMCGYPAAGKTRRAAEIAAALEARGKTVHIVSETPLGIDRREGYLVAASEKRTRGALKSEVERLLNGQEVVILDSLNYIKGFRYELHCTTRLQKTPLCVVHVATSQAQCMEWHQMGGSPYGDDLVTEMFARFECPDSRNRWDKPLFTLEPTEDLPEEDIYAALFEQKQMKPTQATQSQPLSETNFLHELDRVTQEVVKVSGCTEGFHPLLANLSFTPANPADITSVNAAQILLVIAIHVAALPHLCRKFCRRCLRPCPGTRLLSPALKRG